MSAHDAESLRRWSAAEHAADLFAIDPHGLGGIVLRAGAGPVRDRWLRGLRSRLTATLPVLRVPAQVTDDRLLGGLDLAATLSAGKPVASTGLIAAADGGLLVLACAERLPPRAAASVAAALDHAEIVLERDGFAHRLPARIGVVALDEGADEDERVAPALAERLSLFVELDDVRPGLPGLLDDDPAFDEARAQSLAEARALLSDVELTASVIEALCEAAAAMGIDSMRAPLLATRVARASAALAGRTHTDASDARVAGQLVLGWRATRMPAPPEPTQQQASEPPDAADVPHDPPDDPPADPPQPAQADAQQALSPPSVTEPDPTPPPDADDENAPPDQGPLSERILEATAAVLPPGLLARLIAAGAGSGPVRAPGRFGAPLRGGQHGRPVGSRRGMPGGGARLDLVETLRAAAPWQPLRRRDGRRRVVVLRDDLRIRKLEQRRTTTTVFIVDASGSAALHRLAEAKGAVELLLADCYVRRDRVALISFRGRAAELMLPPTRSLVRARRSLSGLPGGGGTPLASALDAAGRLAEDLRRRGDVPVMVLLSDCRANVCRDGTGGRTEAAAQALQAAQALRAGAVESIVIDTSALPQPGARELAMAMGARYVALPHADARRLSDAVRQRA